MMRSLKYSTEEPIAIVVGKPAIEVEVVEALDTRMTTGIYSLPRRNQYRATMLTRYNQMKLSYKNRRRITSQIEIDLVSVAYLMSNSTK